MLSDVNDNAFGISTDFVVAIPSDKNAYEFYDLYNRYKRQGTKLNVTFYGEWKDGNGLAVNLVQPTAARRSNFFGLSIRVHFYQVGYFIWTHNNDRYR